MKSTNITSKPITASAEALLEKMNMKKDKIISDEELIIQIGAFFY